MTYQTEHSSWCKDLKSWPCDCGYASQRDTQTSDYAFLRHLRMKLDDIGAVADYIRKMFPRLDLVFDLLN